MAPAEKNQIKFGNIYGEQASLFGKISHFLAVQILKKMLLESAKVGLQL